jgi:hypothetical protein
MTNSAVDIDRIVREVVQRLGGSQPAAEAPPRDCGSEELRLSARVVSLAELDAQLAQPSGRNAAARTAGRPTVDTRGLAERLRRVKKLAVRPGAIVTPAVRDLLHQHHISLAVESEPRASAEAVALAVAVLAARCDASALMRSLAQQCTVQQLARTDLVTVLDELAELVAKGGWLGLLITEQAIAAVCLANRHRSVRASAVLDLDAAREAIDVVGANLLIVNPAKTSNAELNRVATFFCRAGPKPCPEAFRIRLESLGS